MTLRLAAAQRLLAVACLIFVAAPAMAATITWTGATDTLWSTASNWDLARAPQNGDDVVMAVSIPLTITNDMAGLVVHSLAVTNLGFILDGNTLGIESGGTITVNAGTPTTFNVGFDLKGPVTATATTTMSLAFAAAITGPGGLSLNGPLIDLQAANTYAGPTVFDVTVCGVAVGGIPPGSAVTTLGGLVVLQPGNHTIGSLAGAAGSAVAIIDGVLTAGGDDTSTTFAGVLEGGVGALVKTGAGTMTLTDANMYLGMTTVDGGRLDVNGSTDSPTTVNAGGTLGGTGVINAAVTVNSGGTLAPGTTAGPGQLTTGNLTLAAGSTFAARINAVGLGNRDFVSTAGTPTIGGSFLQLSWGFVPGNFASFGIMGGSVPVGQFATVTSSIPVIINYGILIGSSVIVTTAGPPDAPIIGAATPGNAQAVVGFVAPTFNGGDGITGYTATCNPGAITGAGSAAATTITVTGLANGTLYDCSVTATNTRGTSAASGTVGVVPLLPAVTTFSGASPTGTGTITASFTGGGATCSFTTAQLIPVTGNPASPPGPAPAVFPHGLFDFTLDGCTQASTITMTIVYPAALPAGTQYWKYGPTPATPGPHWYVLPATITGNTVVFTITDGGVGDDDLVANGTIVDQGGPGNPGPIGSPTAIPTLHEWALVLLGLLMMSSGLYYARRRRLM
jgi:autotransporter-associated beta strand protein